MRTLNPEQGLAREDSPPLLHGEHLTLELQVPEQRQERTREEQLAVGTREGCQVGQILWVKTKVLEQPCNEALARRHRIAASKGITTKGEVKHGLLFRHAMTPITVGHGQLVEVSNQRR